MNNKSRMLTQGAIIAALYAVLTHAQNLLLPGSATWAIQMRISECMCVLALFTPSAIWGLGVGCFLFNILYAGALPLDWLIGPLATVLAALAMYAARRITLKGFPLVALFMPALFNAVYLERPSGGLGAERVYWGRLLGKQFVCGGRGGHCPLYPGNGSLLHGKKAPATKDFSVRNNL